MLDILYQHKELFIVLGLIAGLVYQMMKIKSWIRAESDSHTKQVTKEVLETHCPTVHGTIDKNFADVKERLAAGEKQFENLDKKIDTINPNGSLDEIKVILNSLVNQ